jgi:hypothetical protein
MCAATLASAQSTPATAPVATAPSAEHLGRIALAIARTQLLDDVLNLPLSAGVTIGDWAARSPDRDRALRRWIRTRPAAATPAQLPGGGWQAAVHVEAANLARELRRLAEAAPISPGGEVDEPASAAEWDEAASEWPPLESRAFVSAESAVASAEPAVAPDQRAAAPDSPPGWEDVTAEGTQLASDAARAMALHALLNEAARLKLTEVYQVREFLADSPAVEQAVRDELAQIAAVEVQYDLDQVAIARAQVHVRDLIAALARVHEAHYAGSEVRTADFRTMRMLVGAGLLRAIGSAAPPESCRLRSAPWPRSATPATSPASQPATATTQAASRPVTTREAR